ncbi:MAG: hypothetical protein JW888_05760 [Pirellulales bacterium]|nr:hypothetical protein [Pirellulales bacterium]
MKLLTARFAGLATLLTLLVVSLGCTGPLLTGAYLLGYGDTQAEFKGLKQKRVVVVCRPLVELKYSNMNASKMIAREVAKLLRQNVSQIDVVSSQKVDEWLDSNATEEYSEIGRAFEADMVVCIDLLGFSIYQGQTLYRGKASYEVKVVDCHTGEVVFQKSPDQSVWPPNTDVPTQEKQESQFRRQFVGVLAGEIARRFYAYDHRKYFASDPEAFD